MTAGQHGLPPAIVINLRHCADRRRVMAAQLQHLGLAHEFCDAVDGRALSAEELAAYDGRRRRLFFGKDLTAGELGCLLSHRKVYRTMVERQIPLALVLEDDTLLSDDLPPVLAEIQALPAAWDMIRFLDREKVYKQSRQLAPLHGDYILARPTGLPGGAFAYLVTLQGAKRLLAQMARNWVPVDTLHGQVWRTGNRVFSVVPSPITHDYATASTIGDVRFEKNRPLSGWERLIFPLSRSALKLYEAFWKSASGLSARRADREAVRAIGAGRQASAEGAKAPSRYPSRARSG